MNEQSFEYRTGQTEPEKSSRGLIAFLLICIIFLCGMVSVLGIANIHLFHQLQQANTPSPLSFAQGDMEPVATEEDALTLCDITFQEQPILYQELYELPAGLYVIDAPEGSPVQPGDVLISFDGVAVTTLENLITLYSQKKAGDTLWFTFQRDGETFSYSTLMDH